MKLTTAVTTYNRPDSVLQAIQSVCQKNSFDSEVILVDDSSDADISEIVRKNCVDYPLKISVHEENKGLASSRNTAISLASGEYFSFCDDDDQWPLGLSARLVEAMEDAPEGVGMAIALNMNRKKSFEQMFDPFPRLTELMKKGMTPPVGSQIYRTELLKEIGGYRTSVLSGVDHDLWVSLAHIDPRVAVAWGEPAIVGDTPSRSRMTTVEDRRRAGIDKSLNIWRDDLCAVFGNSFYEHFVKSYQQYLEYNFFVQSVRKREYLDSLRRIKNAPWLFKKLINKCWRRMIFKPACTLFPEFRDF